MLRQDREKLLEQTLKVIQSNQHIITIPELVHELGIGRRGFYNRFENFPDMLEDINNALEDNKMIIKQEIRQKLLKNGNPVALISLYKILGTPEEREALGSPSKGKDELGIAKEIKLKID